MSNQEFVAKGGTRFERDDSTDSAVIVGSDAITHLRLSVPLSDLLEFARHVEGQEKQERTVATLKELHNHPQFTPPLPLSRRTEVLAMMAATIWRDARGEWKPDEIAAEAKVLLAAVEEAEAK